MSANVPVSPTMNPAIYAWQGLRYDPLTGQYDNLGRRYNQQTGTFTSQDPSGLAGGMNLYGSRKNNPLLYADYDGKNPAFILFLLRVGAQAVLGLTFGDIFKGNIGGIPTNVCEPQELKDRESKQRLEEYLRQYERSNFTQVPRPGDSVPNPIPQIDPNPGQPSYRSR